MNQLEVSIELLYAAGVSRRQAEVMGPRNLINLAQAKGLLIEAKGGTIQLFEVRKP